MALRLMTACALLLLGAVAMRAGPPRRRKLTRPIRQR